MSQGSDDKKIDYKSIGLGGAGGGVLVAIVSMFQNQGIDLIKQNIEMQNKLAIEKTIHNSRLIEQNSENVRDIKRQVETGFSDLQKTFKDDIKELYSILRINGQQQWQMSDQNVFSQSINKKLDEIELRILKLEAKKGK